MRGRSITLEEAFDMRSNAKVRALAQYKNLVPSPATVGLPNKAWIPHAPPTAQVRTHRSIGRVKGNNKSEIGYGTP